MGTKDAMLAVYYNTGFTLLLIVNVILFLLSVVLYIPTLGHSWHIFKKIWDKFVNYFTIPDDSIYD